MGLDLVLRTSLIWNGEVMDDRVFERTEPITLGHAGKPTFVIPDLGLPADFAIVRPGSTGHLLVLGEHMRGVVCLGGRQQEVAAVVAGEAFHAVPLEVGDWGVVELDETGTCKLFFQFVRREEHAEIVTRKQLHIGGLGFGVFSLVGAAIFAAKGVGLGEALFRAIALTALIFAGAAVARLVMKQNGESQASLAFSIILHTAILSFTFHVYSEQSAFAFPQPRELTATYLVSRPADPTPVVARITATVPTLGPAVGMAEPLPVVEVPAAPPSGGNRGGAGALRPSRRGAAPPSPFGVLANRDVLAVVDRDIGGDVGVLGGVSGNGRERGEAGPPGPLRTTRGDGRDPRGPAGVHQQAKEIGPIAVRGAVCVGAGCTGGAPVDVTPPPTADPDGPVLTAKEVDEVVRRRAGIFRACYQREVNRVNDLTGSVVMKWRITPSGGVVGVQRAGGTLANQNVLDCLTRNLGALTFPAKGGATVVYPFVFSVGG